MTLRRIFRGMLAGAERPPRPWRPQWLPRGTRLQSEATAHPHAPAERAELFLAPDGTTTEVEVLNWLYGTVCLTKPEAILETGTHRGFGTVALAAACKANGFGMVHAVEIDAACCSDAERRLNKAGLRGFVDLHCDDSRHFLATTPVRFQFAFFDSLPEIRAREFQICRERGILNGIAAFHDTSPMRTQTMDRYPDEVTHRKFREDLRALAQGDGTTGFFETRFSRGLFVIFLGD